MTLEQPLGAPGRLRLQLLLLNHKLYSISSIPMPKMKKITSIVLLDADVKQSQECNFQKRYKRLKKAISNLSFESVCDWTNQPHDQNDKANATRFSRVQLENKIEPPFSCKFVEPI